jgi:hypothetical protein
MSKVGLCSGAVIDAAISSLKTGEVNLFRQFYSKIHPGAVALGDRIFGSYADICLLGEKGVDSVFRLHGRRKCDFRRGKRLGRTDHIVVWQKPKQCPPGRDRQLFDSLPRQIRVRELRFQVSRKGFRPQQVTLVTTLIDAVAYPKTALAERYRLRWQVEMDLRYIKTQLQMEFLTCQTPDMVKKGFYVHLLAYNLIRAVQKAAGHNHGVQPTEHSFYATIQHLCIFVSVLALAEAEQRHHLYTLLFVLVATEKLLFRPNRVEPRVKKRRPKSYPWMPG